MCSGTCVDEKVIYLRIEVCFTKLPNFKKNVTFFPLLRNREIVKRKEELLLHFGCWHEVFVHFFHMSVYKKFCPLFTMGLVLHFEVNKRICIA